MMPPTLSRSLCAARIAATIFSAAAGSGERTMLFSTSFQSTVSAHTPPIIIAQARTDTPSEARNIFASAPAATRIEVSRPEERPPPR